MRDHEDGILAECKTMADYIEEVMGRGGTGDAAPSDKEEIEHMEVDAKDEAEEDPSKEMGFVSSVHLD